MLTTLKTNKVYPQAEIKKSVPHAPSLLVNDILERLLGREHMAKKVSFIALKNR